MISAGRMKVMAVASVYTSRMLLIMTIYICPFI
jgi:hypothetical protein